MRHAPAPWKVGNKLAGTVEDVNGTVVATISGGVDGSPSDNALLVASSPDLLNALKAIVARINGEWDHPALVAAGSLGSECEDILRIAVTAISKSK